MPTRRQPAQGPGESVRRSTSCEASTTMSGLPLEDVEEFAQAQRAALDFVFTVCDNAAGESCPVWPGQPMTAHWGVPDPGDATAAGRARARLQRGLPDAAPAHQVFTALPIRSLDRLSLHSRLETSAAWRRNRQGA